MSKSRGTPSPTYQDAFCDALFGRCARCWIVQGWVCSALATAWSSSLADTLVSTPSVSFITELLSHCILSRFLLTEPSPLSTAARYNCFTCVGYHVLRPVSVLSRLFFLLSLKRTSTISLLYSDGFHPSLVVSHAFNSHPILHSSFRQPIQNPSRQYC